MNQCIAQVVNAAPWLRTARRGAGRRRRRHIGLDQRERDRPQSARAPRRRRSSAGVKAAPRIRLVRSRSACPSLDEQSEGGRSRPFRSFEAAISRRRPRRAARPSSICFLSSGTGSLGIAGGSEPGRSRRRRRTRWMFGNFMIDLSNSIITGAISASTHPLSCPAYLPGDVDSTDVGAAPLKVMSYFSYGSIVRL